MSSQPIRHVDADDPDYYDDPAWTCDRCGDDFPAETGSWVLLALQRGSSAEWRYCDDCTDSFTAWRLTKDPPIPADELEDPF